MQPCPAASTPGAEYPLGSPEYGVLAFAEVPWLRGCSVYFIVKKTDFPESRRKMLTLTLSPDNKKNLHLVAQASRNQ